MAEVFDSVAQSDDALRRRVGAFLTTSAHGREAVELLENLSALGEPCIFGGMLRDLARGPTRSFASDIDIVVDCEPEALDLFLGTMPSHRNRFGGYRLQRQNGWYDVWALSNTWAIKQGHVQANSLAGLTTTTFFSWDSVIYLYKTREIARSRQYYENLTSGIVDLNLKNNPSLLGAVARTLRILADWKSGISPALADFLFEQLKLNRAEDIVAAQRATIGHVSVGLRQLAPLLRELSKRDFFETAFRYTRQEAPRSFS